MPRHASGERRRPDEAFDALLRKVPDIEPKANVRFGIGRWVRREQLGSLGLAGPSRALNPLMERRVLPIAEGLAAGEHVAVIHSANGPPGAFMVGRAAPLPWLWVLVPALLLLALVVTGALLCRAIVLFFM